MPPLRQHHPLRYVVLLGFVALMGILIAKSDRGETIRLAAEQAAVYRPERAPVTPTLPVQEVAHLEEEMNRGLLPDSNAANASLHLSTPYPLRGIYLTGWSAGNEKKRSRIYDLIDAGQINAVIVDIKDATGRLSYQPIDPELKDTGVGTNKIKNLQALTDELHKKGVYIIGRLSVFQDPYYSQVHPEDAFRDKENGGLWRDYKNISWLRPDRESVWQYVVAIARDAHTQGFDEINVDYVRYPSDGPLQTLEGRGNSAERIETIRSFFQYISEALHADSIVLSADLFGLTMSAKDDLGIGQKLESIVPYVDYVCPMVYPSHFAAGAYGIDDPASHPYEIIKTSLSLGIEKLSKNNEPTTKLRPWLQDFDLGAIYTEEMVKAQISASEELGLTSWTLWDPANNYTKEALTSNDETGYTQ